MDQDVINGIRTTSHVFLSDGKAKNFNEKVEFGKGVNVTPLDKFNIDKV